MKTLNVWNHKDYDLGWCLYFAVHRPIVNLTNDRFFEGVFLEQRRTRKRNRKLYVAAYVADWIAAVRQTRA